MKPNGIILVTSAFALVNLTMRVLFTDEFDWSTLSNSIAAAILFSLFFFTYAIKAVKKIGEMAVNSVTPLDLTVNEKPLLESSANHLKGREAVGGKLFLTDKRLVFKSHKFNLQNHEQQFPLNEIQGIAQSHRYGGRAVELTCKNNKIERFVVEAPSRWTRSLRGNHK